MSNSETQFCVYCKTNPVAKSEHVFPKGLGGQSLYMDCVCDTCNNEFSVYERELIQKSPIGIMRSVAGLEGRNPNKNRPAPLKGANLFFFDEESKVVYEMGQHHKFYPYVRPQLIEIENELYLELPSESDFKLMNLAITRWIHNGALLIDLPKTDGGFRTIKFIKHDNRYLTEELYTSSTKNSAIFQLTKTDYEFYNFLTPRLFMDDDNDLHVRASSKEEAVAFIQKLLHALDQRKTFKSYKHNFPEQPVINVQMSFNGLMLERALVKIGLNCLMHYYPKTKENVLLDEAKRFVKYNTPFQNRFLDERKYWIDNLTDSHSVLFVQQREGLLVRINLFEGSFIFSFYLKDLIVQTPPSTSGIDINYVEKMQEFKDINALGYSRRKYFDTDLSKQK